MDDRLPFLRDGPLPAAFRRWTVTLAPGQTLPYVEAHWHRAFVTVRSGSIDVECLAGGSATFAAGAMIWTTGLELRAIHNRRAEPAVLVAVRRVRDSGALPPAPPGAGRAPPTP